MKNNRVFCVGCHCTHVVIKLGHLLLMKKPRSQHKMCWEKYSVMITIVGATREKTNELRGNMFNLQHMQYKLLAVRISHIFPMKKNAFFPYIVKQFLPPKTAILTRSLFYLNVRSFLPNGNMNGWSAANDRLIPINLCGHELHRRCRLYLMWK